MTSPQFQVQSDSQTLTAAKYRNGSILLMPKVCPESAPRNSVSQGSPCLPVQGRVASLQTGLGIADDHHVNIIVIFPAILLRVSLHQDGQVVKALDVGFKGHMSTWVQTPFLVVSLGLPRWHRGKESACQCRKHRRGGFNPWVGTTPWRRKW